MSIYSKRQVALAQLETALKLYEDGGNLFSSITLAGATEEILDLGDAAFESRDSFV